MHLLRIPAESRFGMAIGVGSEREPGALDIKQGI